MWQGNSIGVALGVGSKGHILGLAELEAASVVARALDSTREEDGMGKEFKDSWVLGLLLSLQTGLQRQSNDCSNGRMSLAIIGSPTVVLLILDLRAASFPSSRYKR